MLNLLQRLKNFMYTLTEGYAVEFHPADLGNSSFRIGAELDLEELQGEVMQAWDERGEAYVESNQIDFGRYEDTVKPEYHDILVDPLLCIKELGYDSFSAYMSNKNKEA